MVEFNIDKVVNAIYNAHLEVDTHVGKAFAIEVAKTVKDICESESSNGRLLTVECVQDIVEEQLMESNKQVAKRYILYREEKARNRSVKKKYKHLSDEFLSKYKHKESPLNQLGSFVFYRTYSRYLPEENRREYWWETIARAVDYNCSLAPNTTRAEAEALYDNIYNLKQQLSGRTLYTGGTQASLRYVLSNYNCSYTTIEHIDDFCDLFYVLMVGTGAGVGIQNKYVEKLPKFRTDINLFHSEWEFTPKSFREDITTTEVNGDTIKIIIGDSKEGFIEGLRTFLNVLTSHSYRTIKNVIIDYNYVRPKGERLVTFGGYASGYESMKNMIHKIYKVVMSRATSDMKKVQLERIDVMDIANIIGENVVSGGVRRTAEIIFVDIDDVDTQNAKSNLYTQDSEGNWIANQSILHRMMSNNSIIYETKPTREQLHEHMQKQRFSGEPGVVNAEAARKRRDNFKGLNPCFTGDMRLLTEEGYKTFESLEDKAVRVVNKDGKVTDGKVWSSGVKEVYEIKFNNRDSITSTGNHVFMTIDGEEVEAKDLKGKRITPYLKASDNFDLEFVKLGFLQGDGNLSRLDSETHKGLEINIGKKDEEIRELFGLTGKDRYEYINGYNETMKNLGFSSKTLPERVLPKSIGTWDDKLVRSFIRGLYSANGSVISNGRITFKTTCSELAYQLQGLLLDRFGINAYITVNKGKDVEFSNGVYECKDSYDLNIQQYKSREVFFNEIGFVHEYKMERLKHILVKQSPMVVNVVNTGRFEKVYDFTEPELHWGVVEGVIAHNCAEILLDSKAVCNLTTVNMVVFVKDGKVDTDEMIKAFKLATRAGYRMTNVDLELYNWDRIQKRDRLLGVSMTGYQEMVGATNLSIDEQKELLATIRKATHEAMREIAKELGLNESLLVTTVKPEGTLSQVFGGVSSGLHFPHSEYYIRRVRINAFDPLAKVAEELGWSVKPEVGQDWETCTTKVIEFPVHSPAIQFKSDVSAVEQLEIYKMFQEYYTDHNSSNTITVKNDEWEDVEQWIWDNWDDFIGVSFLSDSDSFYQLMPYEAIDKQTYEELAKNTAPFNPALLKKYETTGVSELDENESCQDGACSVR